MAEFTIRVVLHDNASWADYTQLAASLASKNILDVITGSDGIRYKLPPAEYQCFGDLTAAQVLDLCTASAQTTGKRHSVLVTQSSGRTWFGLDPV